MKEGEKTSPGPKQRRFGSHLVNLLLEVGEELVCVCGGT